MHAPTPEQQETHRGAILYSYGEQFWMRWAGSASTGRVTPGELRDRVAENVVDVTARGMGGIFAPARVGAGECRGIARSWRTSVRRRSRLALARLFVPRDSGQDSGTR
jgi:hypothetical protein